jgi:hypothetical protein
VRLKCVLSGEVRTEDSGWISEGHGGSRACLLNAATGVVSGTPNVGGLFAFTIQATDADADVATVACSISITD